MRDEFMDVLAKLDGMDNKDMHSVITKVNVNFIYYLEILFLALQSWCFEMWTSSLNL